MSKGLSTDPYKGVRDFYPEDYFVQEYITNTMREIAERYGYLPYDASILEPTELYEAKSGDEIVNEQTYTFEDRGGRRVTLRPEMTPTVARMVARKRREHAFPLRWYSIPNLFRYERPQKGRLREHWQLNADLFGIEGIDAEVEIISLAHDLLRAFGLENNQFEIRINDRVLLNQSFEDMGISGESAVSDTYKLLDKKEKMSESEFQEKFEAIAGKNASFELEMNDTLKSILDRLAARGITNAIFSPTLSRGFDYYTGVVFEVFDTGAENNRSLFGGGRYDNLLEVFGEEAIPAVGFGMGDVRMRDVLETYNLLPIYQPTTQLCVCYADPERVSEVDKIVAQLRENEINVVTANPSKKVGDQIAYADKLRIPYVLCIGSQELDNNTFTIKELATREKTTLAQDELAKFFQS